MTLRILNCIFILLGILQAAHAQPSYSVKLNEGPARGQVTPAPGITRIPLRQWYPKSPAPIVLSKPSLVNSKALIVLDPGHGGHDVGTQSISKPRYQEKSLNLVTANFVKGYLEQLGYRVVMTRKEDEFISLDKRARFANELKPDMFISIHYNSAPSSEANGVEVFFYHSKENAARAGQSKKLAQAVLKNVLSNTKANSRGVKHGNFAVIRETDMPAVLIEGGFITNEKELKSLKDPLYLKKLAWGIAKGVEEYWARVPVKKLSK
jgi:N-acetylmuramoyl-L-alanine amidase